MNTARSPIGAARRLVLLALWAGVAATACLPASADGDAFPEKQRAYEAGVRRPSLEKRTNARVGFAETQDARARAILMSSYARAEEPQDQVRYLLASIVTRWFGREEDLAAIREWRKVNARPEDAWLWYSTFGVDRAVEGHEAPIAFAKAPGDPCLRGAAIAVLAGVDPDILSALPEVIASAGKDPFERAVLVEACADALSKQTEAIGKPWFHDAATKVIVSLDDPLTPPRTRLVVARRLARTFSKPGAILESKYWLRVLRSAEGAEQAGADDTYAQPPPPTFAGVAATGKRIVYLIDLSDSMMAPVSPKEIQELRKPRGGEITPGDGAGKLPPPAPKPEEPPPPKEPLADTAVDWKRVKTRFDAARELLKASVRGLAPDTAFAVVLFGSKAELAKTTPGMTPAAPGVAAKLAAELDAMRPGPVAPNRPYGTLKGLTNLHGAFRKAYKLKDVGLSGPYEYVHQETFFQGCDTIFVLSDGDPSYSDWVTVDKRDPGDRAGDPETGNKIPDKGELQFYGPYHDDEWVLTDVRRMNLLRKVEIHTIGIGEASGSLLGALSVIGGGATRTISPDAK